MNYAIVGCGGIGTWLAMLLSKQMKEPSLLHLFDGDTVEVRNLDRQLFDESDVGKFKSECLASKLSCEAQVHNTYFRYDSLEEFRNGIIFVGADNHPARRCALECSDETGCEVIIAANEYTDAEAYYYSPRWKSSDKDPRTYYPELQTDHSDDPTMPCTGEVQIAHPQLAISNSMAASYAMWLYWFWKEKAKSLDGSIASSFPVMVRSNFSRVTYKTIGDF